MKRGIVIALILVLAAVAGAFLYMRHGHLYEISEDELQQHVQTQFPIEKCVLVFCLELSEPFVRLNDGQTRIEFGSNALMEIAFSNEEYDGAARFSGELAYDSEKISFFLEDSRLESLEVSGVSEKHKDNLDQLASMLVSEYLRANPIYSFKDTTFELIAPWLELKEVTMNEGLLRVRVGLAM